MEHTTKNLENNFIYRFVKVVYILSFLAVSLIIIAIGWTTKPTKYVDNQKSYLACENGKSYTLETAKVYVWSGDTELSGYNEADARKVCAYAIADDYLDKYETPTNRNYTLNLTYATRGSWISTILIWGIGISASYVVLNLARETLLYIFLGKKFSWEWLQKVWVFLNSN